MSIIIKKILQESVRKMRIEMDGCKDGLGVMDGLRTDYVFS